MIFIIHFKENFMQKQIREKNDGLRKTLPYLPKPHRFVWTQAIAALIDEGEISVDSLIAAIRDFSDFSEANDPHGEHDFGKVEIGDYEFFWKFDYYDESFEGWQENGIRVLTVMLVSEY